jgi:hypothetical protein
VLAAQTVVAAVDTPVQRTLTWWLEALVAVEGGENSEQRIDGLFATLETLAILSGATSELDELRRVLFWFRSVGFAKSYVPVALSALWHRRRRVALREMGGAGFVGRDKELAQLQRWVTSNDPSILAVDAIGGTGKTALLARFQLDLSSEPIVIAHLDFDNPRLDVRSRSSVFAQLFEVLSHTLPGLRPMADELDALAFDDIDGVSVSAETRSLSDSRLSKVLFDAQSYLRAVHTAGSLPRLLVVLDTFERPLRQSVESTRALLDEIFQVFAQRSRRFGIAGFSTRIAVRVLVAGRGVARELYAEAWPLRLETLSLRELEPDVALALLDKLGVAGDAAAHVVAVVPHRPLTLRLVARAVRVRTVLDLEEVRAIATEHLVDGFLHMRILRQIADPRVAALLKGFVLRHLTAKVILDLLRHLPSPPVRDLDDAGALLVQIRGISDLVEERIGGEGLTLRAEVRDEIVALIRRDDPDRVLEIHRASITYFARSDARETAFHIMMARPDARVADVEHNLDRMSEPEIRELIARHRDRSRVRRAMQPEIVRRFELLVRDGRFDEADAFVRSLAYQFLPTFDLLRVEAILRRRQGRRAEAAAVARLAGPYVHPRGPLLDVLRVQAWSASPEDRAGFLERALAEIHNTSDTSLLDAREELAACADLALIAGEGGVHDELRVRVFRLMSSLTDETLRSDRTTLLAAAIVSGARSHLIRALDLDALADFRDVPRATLHAAIYAPFARLRARIGLKALEAHGLTDPPARPALLAKCLRGLLAEPGEHAIEIVRRVLAEAHHLRTTYVPDRAVTRAAALEALARYVDELPPFIRTDIARDLGPAVLEEFTRGSGTAHDLVRAADKEAILELIQQLLERESAGRFADLFELRRRISVAPRFEWKAHEQLVDRWLTFENVGVEAVGEAFSAWEVPWVRQWSARPLVAVMDALEVLNRRAGFPFPEAAPPEAAPAPLGYRTTVADPFAEVLVEGNRPFVGRAVLRRHLRTLTEPEGPSILVIDGATATGKSYSQQLINHVAMRRGFVVVSFGVTDEVGSATLDDLLKSLEDPQTTMGTLRRSMAEHAAQQGRRVVLTIDGLARHPRRDELVLAFADRVSVWLHRVRLVLIDFGGMLPPHLESVTLREEVEPFTTDDLVDAIDQIARARRWIGLENVRERLTLTEGEPLAARSEDLRQLVLELEGLNAGTHGPPRLVARFSLDSAGLPRSERLSTGGQKHFVVMLQIDDAPAQTTRVTYQLHESFDGNIREVAEGRRFFEQIWTYGDFTVLATLGGGSHETRLERRLTEMLRDGHRMDMSREIGAAIAELARN